MSDTSALRVFISYSHDDRGHADRVAALSARLRQDGIDWRIDQYYVRPPEGWPNWMQQQIDEADTVLVVCTKTYRERFERRQPSKTGRGGDVSFVGLRHYVVLAREPRFLGDVLRLLLYVGCNVSISLVLGYGAAVIITRSMAAAGLFRSLLLLPWITPPVVSAMMFRSM